MSQLNTLIVHLLGELTKGDRQKIMTICTIDVHARDVVAKLIFQKIDNSQAFIWLSQLRHRCVHAVFPWNTPRVLLVSATGGVCGILLEGGHFRHSLHWSYVLRLCLGPTLTILLFCTKILLYLYIWLCTFWWWICRWDEEKKQCFANICDAEFLYSYEYLGNTPRLVITPLTDR